MKRWRYIYGMGSLTALLLLAGCGGGGGGSGQSAGAAGHEGVYADSPVANVGYTCGTFKGKTDARGVFRFGDGDACTFSIGGVTLDRVDKGTLEKALKSGAGKVTIVVSPQVARFVQTLDEDGNASNGITIPDNAAEVLKKAGLREVPGAGSFTTKMKELKSKGLTIKRIVSQEEAQKHLSETKRRLGTPTITLKGDETIEVPVGVEFVDPGAVAKDPEDGTLTVQSDARSSVHWKEVGRYIVTYTATDRHGNVVTARRIVDVLDMEGPVITMKGNNPYTVSLGGTFSDPGATCRDNYDPVCHVKAEGEVNTNRLGSYTIVYKAVDRAGNETEAKRTVVVADKTPPVVELHGANPVTVPLGSSYKEAGAVCRDNVDLECRVVISGKVDTAKVGSYKLHYTATDSAGNRAKDVVRVVVVKDLTPPVIRMLGNDPMTVEVKTNFTDPGATCSDNYDPSCHVTVTGSVNMSQTGTYTLTYHAVDSAGNQAKSVSRTVRVKDLTPPTIVLTGKNPLVVEVGTNFTDPGATCSDNYDSSCHVTVSGSVDTSKVGTYTLRYDAKDQAGNTARQVLRTVEVKDLTPPTITLTGDNPMTVEVKTNFTDPGATCSDNYDSSCQVTVSGSVDTSKIGTYTLSYSATDSSGNRARALSRTVKVLDRTPPVITIQGDNPMTVALNSTYTDPGATCEDNYDANCSVSSSVNVDTSTAGTYYVYYRALDSSSNEAQARRTVTVEEQNTTTDIVTKGSLMWEDTDHAWSSGPAMDWNSSRDYCADLSLEGYDDWRLPTPDELVSIRVETSEDDDNAIVAGFHPVTQGEAVGYWSSELIDSDGDNVPDRAVAAFFWDIVDNMDGMIFSEAAHVRCVRSVVASYSGAAAPGDFARLQIRDDNMSFELNGTRFGSVSGSITLSPAVPGDIFFFGTLENGQIVQIAKAHNLGIAIVPVDDQGGMTLVSGLAVTGEVDEQKLTGGNYKSYIFADITPNGVEGSVLTLVADHRFRGDTADGSVYYGCWKAMGDHIVAKERAANSFDELDCSDTSDLNDTSAQYRVVVKPGESRAGIVVDHVDGSGFGIGLEQKALSPSEVNGTYEMFAWYNDDTTQLFRADVGADENGSLGYKLTPYECDNNGCVLSTDENRTILGEIAINKLCDGSDFNGTICVTDPASGTQGIGFIDPVDGYFMVVDPDGAYFGASH